MSSVHKIRYLIFTGVILTSLSCRLLSRVPEIPKETIPVTTEAAEAFTNEITKAVEEAQKIGKYFLTIKENELTSAVALELALSGFNGISQPQIFLRENQMLVSGYYSQDNTNLPIELAITIAVSNGKLAASLAAASIGGIPMPQQMVESLSQQIGQSLETYLLESVGNVVVDSIIIADGTMQIEGEFK
jgi:hypothetical protein